MTDTPLRNVEFGFSGTLLSTFTSHWKLRDFSSLESKCGKGYCSSTFSPEGSKSSFHIALYPGGEKKENHGQVSCFIRCTDSPASGISIKYELTLQNKYGAAFKTGTNGTWQVLRSGSDSGFPDFISKEELARNLFENLLVVCVEGTCGFSTMVSSLDGKTKYVAEDVATSPYAKLTEDLGNLLGHKDSCDVKMAVVNRGYIQWQNKRLKVELLPDSMVEYISVHREILVARSKHFASVLSDSARGRHHQPIEVSNFDVDTVNSLLRFLYTGKIGPSSTYKCLRLLKAANEYGIDDLKEYCSNILVSRIDDNNASLLLHYGDKFKAPKLKKCAAWYFCKNRGTIKMERHRLTFEKFPKIMFDIIEAMKLF